MGIVFFYNCIYAQNQNLSNGNIFDGEPYLSINPTNSQNMVVAWMGYFPYTKAYIKTKVTFDGGKTWSSLNSIPHTNTLFGSADPSLAFDNSGNVFLSFIDFNKISNSGAVFVVKSTDGGLTWGNPVEVINVNSDTQKPIDRPWIGIDRSGGVNEGNIYITTMPPTVFGYLPPPYHPYLSVSLDGGNSFQWRYLDTTNWLAGNIIPQPSASNCVASDGSFYAVYPSYVYSQNVYPQYIIASSQNGGKSFSYNTVFSSLSNVSDTLAKKGYLLITDPSNPNHLTFFYLGTGYGDIDVFMRESFDKGVNWSDATRINDDPIANNRMQDLVWADFDNDGDLVVSWRDRRNGTDSTYTTSSEIWGAVRSKDSTDFSANFRISDSSVPYDTILSYAGNDFMCIKFADDTLNAVWGDTRNGKLNIWFQRMSMTGLISSSQLISSENVPDIEIYPNPSFSSITIEGKHIAKVIVFNEKGKVVLTKQNLNGNENIVVGLKGLSKGIYFVQVTTSKGIILKKIIKQ